MSAPMTQARWDAICNDVTDQMLAYTRPFVTPLTTENTQAVWLTGTGSFVDLDARRILLTCEHVSRDKPVHYSFYSSDDVFESAAWTEDTRQSVDAAFTEIDATAWNATTHRAAAVPAATFAQRHRTSQREELLFFRGFAGDNATYGFGIHNANGSGYCSQEVQNGSDAAIFEMNWNPQQARYTNGTSSAARSAVTFNNPRGFSGSLVWNTRYLEVTESGGQWSPADAVITGLLRRWDTAKGTLLVWRVEHLRVWLQI